MQIKPFLLCITPTLWTSLHGTFKHCKFIPFRSLSLICCPRETYITFHQLQQRKLTSLQAIFNVRISYRILNSKPLPSLCKSVSSYHSDLSNMTENRYITCYAKLGTSGCKKCKQKIAKGALRIGKVVPNPFSDEGGDMKQWYHPQCIFETFVRARAATKKIEDTDDLEGYDDLEPDDKDAISKLIADFQAKAGSKTPKKKPLVQNKLPSTPSPVKTKEEPEDKNEKNGHHPKGFDAGTERDNSFRQFRRLCANIAEQNSYTEKSRIVSDYIKNGNDGDGFKGDLYLVIKFLLPGVMKTVYNLNNKQLVKLFSQIFGTNLQEMIEDLNQGDVAETVKIFFEQSKQIQPKKKSLLSIQEIDAFLTELSQLTREDDQQRILKRIANKCTSNDLKMVVRLIKHDLRINAGAKHILEGLDPNAYEAFQASRNLQDVVERVVCNTNESKPGMMKKLSIRANLMTPVLPMLAEACRSVEQAMRKCPNGFYAEIKYDGERVQVHKKGDDFCYFSRSLKPVMPHKVALFKDYIPKAFETGDDLILDSEVLLVDTKTQKPMPFGTLGVHKKAAFKDAQVCLFIFDCLHINGENLMDKPIKKRRAILQQEMKEIPNRIMFSEYQHVTKPNDLQSMMNKVFREGLEGLVLKDVNSIYEPGKRHWLKVKKDYLHQGSMADSADLIVLGGYFGTGNKGGIMSVFLMGVYDPVTSKFCTVTKCGSGLDDEMLDRLQKDLDMVKIGKDFSNIPYWLNIKKPLTPDFVVADPKKAPVWEIIGAEFSKAEIHTAGGISIRFPRIQKFRDDKTWETATNLPRLKKLFRESKEKSDIEVTVPIKKGENGSDGTEETGSDEMDTSSTGSASTNKTLSSTTNKTSLTTTPKKAIKRSAEDESLDTTPKKKSKPMCAYGVKCYQTNPTHISSFDHPPGYRIPQKTPTKPSTPESSINKKLPDVFQGCKILLPSDTDEFKKLKRFIIAFDGDLVPEFDQHAATHIVVAAKEKSCDSSMKSKMVTTNWLWDCIKKKTLLPVKSYQP